MPRLSPARRSPCLRVVLKYVVRDYRRDSEYTTVNDSMEVVLRRQPGESLGARTTAKDLETQLLGGKPGIVDIAVVGAPYLKKFDPTTFGEFLWVSQVRTTQYCKEFS